MTAESRDREIFFESALIDRYLALAGANEDSGGGPLPLPCPVIVLKSQLIDSSRLALLITISLKTSLSVPRTLAQ